MPDRQRRRYAPRLPREERREQLLDAALTVLQDCPLHELTMEAVAEAGGVGKPVLYTAFRTRTELVTALLIREHQRGLNQILTALPKNLSVTGPRDAYTATVTGFLRCVLENPTRWRLILTVPDSAPRDYRAAVRNARNQILGTRLGGFVCVWIQFVQLLLISHEISPLNVVGELDSRICRPIWGRKKQLQGRLNINVRGT